MNADHRTIRIVGGMDDASFAIDWRPGDDDVIRCVLASNADGITLHFGPTMAVAGWPAWLRAIAVFGSAGGEAAIRLDPLRTGDPGFGSVGALALRGTRTRAELTALLNGIADALRERCPEPSPNERQAIETCAGLFLAFVSEDGIVPTCAPLPHLFLPSPLPILVDDVNDDSVRQHVRLTYRLPRLDGRWTDACSFRLFRGEKAFGIEFRALAGDHLPTSLRAACAHDDMGPVLRFSVDRAGRGTEFTGDADQEAALRLVRAIARQVSSDLVPADGPVPIAGFEAPYWRHWLAALPDLLATRATKPLGAAG